MVKTIRAQVTEEDYQELLKKKRELKLTWRGVLFYGLEIDDGIYEARQRALQRGPPAKLVRK